MAYFVRSHLKMETEEVVSVFVDAQEENRIGASSTEKKISDSAKNKGKKNIFEVKESGPTSFLSDEARKGEITVVRTCCACVEILYNIIHNNIRPNHNGRPPAKCRA